MAEWVDPPFAAGHWVPELVDIAGGREVLGQAGAPSFTTDWDAVRAAAPDVCVIAPCGYDAARGAAEAAASPAATCAPRVVAVDANAYLSRPGPRIVDGAELLGAILHPDAVPAFPEPAGVVLRDQLVGTPGAAWGTVAPAERRLPFGDHARVR